MLFEHSIDEGNNGHLCADILRDNGYLSVVQAVMSADNF